MLEQKQLRLFHRNLKAQVQGKTNKNQGRRMKLGQS